MKGIEGYLLKKGTSFFSVIQLLIIIIFYFRDGM